MTARPLGKASLLFLKFVARRSTRLGVCWSVVAGRDVEALGHSETSLTDVCVGHK